MNAIKFECKFSLQIINPKLMHFTSFIEKCIFLIIIIHSKKLKNIFHVGFLKYIIFIVMIVAQVYLMFPNLNSFKCGPWLLKVVFIFLKKSYKKNYKGFVKIGFLKNTIMRIP